MSGEVSKSLEQCVQASEAWKSIVCLEKTVSMKLKPRVNLCRGWRGKCGKMQRKRDGTENNVLR